MESRWIPAEARQLKLVVQRRPRLRVTQVDLQVRGDPCRRDVRPTGHLADPRRPVVALFRPASARFDFAKDCKVHSGSLFMTVYAVTNAFQSIDDVLLTPDAAAHAADRWPSRSNGSVLRQGLRTGGLFVGVVQVGILLEGRAGTRRREVECQLRGVRSQDQRFARHQRLVTTKPIARLLLRGGDRRRSPMSSTKPVPGLCSPPPKS